MGDLANAVAKLEEEASGARELRQIVERLDMEIAARMDEIETVGTALLELHGDLDDQIAEYDYMAVEQSLSSLRGLVDAEEVLPAVDAVLLLTALRDDTPVPDLRLPLSLFARDDVGEHPRLTQEDLDRAFEAALARAEQRWEEIWGDHTWADDDERDSQRAEDRADARQEAIKDRASRAGAHIMELVDYIGDTLWPDLVEAVEAGDRGRAVEVLAAACAAARETEPAYKLYEVNLSIQYESSPMSLGAMGELLSDFETWLGSPRAE
ncbi:hypothetical protein N4P33_20245 [Streptomyces sp. 15-116A]|uniref:hypothetical protein n=1 Tax=Streptomyces sp. 15-116A TaxID=2259035 RepID=UPI0021B36429|nr:hypothetical protein [Streptomyces sp. 15-116A]MCT7354468.1 hypothetical protein [Streptomyces sp. 15-116A]